MVALIDHWLPDVRHVVAEGLRVALAVARRVHGEGRGEDVGQLGAVAVAAAHRCTATTKEKRQLLTVRRRYHTRHCTYSSSPCHRSWTPTAGVRR